MYHPYEYRDGCILQRRTPTSRRYVCGNSMHPRFKQKGLASKGNVYINIQPIVAYYIVAYLTIWYLIFSINCMSYDYINLRVYVFSYQTNATYIGDIGCMCPTARYYIEEQRLQILEVTTPPCASFGVLCVSFDHFFGELKRSCFEYFLGILRILEATMMKWTLVFAATSMPQQIIPFLGHRKFSLNLASVADSLLIPWDPMWRTSHNRILEVLERPGQTHWCNRNIYTRQLKDSPLFEPEATSEMATPQEAGAPKSLKAKEDPVGLNEANEAPPDSPEAKQEHSLHSLGRLFSTWMVWGLGRLFGMTWCLKEIRSAANSDHFILIYCASQKDQGSRWLVLVEVFWSFNPNSTNEVAKEKLKPWPPAPGWDDGERAGTGQQNTTWSEGPGTRHPENSPFGGWQNVTCFLSRQDEQTIGTTG